MQPDNNLIVFDFDGVICNSFHDSLYTAIHAYFRVKPQNNLPLDAPLTPDNIYIFEQENPGFCRIFADLMPLGNFAMDYHVSLEILEKDLFDKITNQDSFIAFKKTINPDLLNRYSNCFYSYRNNLQQTQPDQWAALLPPFEGIPATVRDLSNNHQIAIATSKDMQSITILLDKYGINDCFKPGSILDKDFAESKREHITLFHNQYKIPYNKIYFIDDKVLHIISVADLGVNCYLAAWGFNTDREHKVALDHGCKTLELTQLPFIIE